MESPMTGNRQFFPNYFLYVSIIGLALTGVALALTGGALTTIVSASTAMPEVEKSKQTQTVLDLRMQNLREVREALAKPLPRPEPLPPLSIHRTQSAARAIHSTIASSARASYAVGGTKLDHNKAIAAARNAFAGIEQRSVNIPLIAYTESDRHSVQ
jgi:hypothetical protein